MQQKHAGGNSSSSQGWLQDRSSSSRLGGEAAGSDSDTQPGLDVYDAAAASAAAADDGGGGGGSGRALVFRPHHVAVAVNGKGGLFVTCFLSMWLVSAWCGALLLLLVELGVGVGVLWVCTSSLF
jgi:hypothetical protein